MNMSAKMLGTVLGITSREVNLLLKENGYINGEPGKWVLTELGKQFAEISQKDNGYGGYAKRTWQFLMWNEDIIKNLKK